ncbi:hypothetical protein P691DRAFT_673687 [Macrolepiota fuliginosa MF-IS2]|uniref:Uncharacterized protein n=1 Tax=Macrolepiota fuliginosa MF-IS2 TaxID=1400762 RepID=A0A9P6C280_9AGAR|nr:hypothetical protein P691DRAFT_673687 [Macrolepiota fuliginosa MF-IS2]
MSQHIQHHHPQQPQYVHYTGPPGAQLTVAPQDTTRQPQPTRQSSQQPAQQQHPSPPTVGTSAATASSSAQALPLVATGDWTKDLVQLAKNAELKKHALTLQLHTAHVLSAHATLDSKSKAVQDIREQKNKLDSERTRLLNALREINEDRDKADLMEVSLEKECNDLRSKITQLTDGEYAIAKRDVDRLRQELGQLPLPSLQEQLEEKNTQYLNERRLNGNESQASSGSAKRPATEQPEGQPATGKRPRGRPKGSKNKAKSTEAV